MDSWEKGCTTRLSYALSFLSQDRVLIHTAGRQIPSVLSKFMNELVRFL
jgi:hypothetical protein